jgi:hypothetical protein
MTAFSSSCQTVHGAQLAVTEQTHASTTRVWPSGGQTLTAHVPRFEIGGWHATTALVAVCRLFPTVFDISHREK